MHRLVQTLAVPHTPLPNVSSELQDMLELALFEFDMRHAAIRMQIIDAKLSSA
jgi:hypothetical protein